MPTQPYYNAAGQRIPGNTTIIGKSLGWSKDPLMYWAWKQGTEGKDFRQAGKDAADAGTFCHAMIEDDIKGNTKAIGSLPVPPMEVVRKAKKGFDNYREWRSGTRFELLTMETPCISEQHQFGTTLDIIARVNDRLCIVECKTSNGVYEEYLIQVAAQKHAWNETHDEKVEGCHILRVGKEHATFTHHFFGELPGCFEAFLDLRDLWDRKKEIGELL